MRPARKRREAGRDVVATGGCGGVRGPSVARGRVPGSNAPMWPTRVLTCVAAFTATACLTPYQSRPSPRIAVVDAVGVRTFVKDGHVVSDGIFGGGLFDLVKDDPIAADDAAAHRTDITWSVGVAAASGAAAAVGIGLLVSQRRDLVVPGGIAAAAGGLGLIPTVILQLTADTHMWRAINRYDDDVEAVPHAAAAQKPTT